MAARVTFGLVRCPFPLQLNVLSYDGYGADVIKTFKMSPDAFAQMALQLAVFKMTGDAAFRWGFGQRNTVMALELLIYTAVPFSGESHWKRLLRRVGSSLPRTAHDPRSE